MHLADADLWAITSSSSSCRLYYGVWISLSSSPLPPLVYPFSRLLSFPFPFHSFPLVYHLQACHSLASSFLHSPLLPPSSTPPTHATPPLYHPTPSPYTHSTAPSPRYTHPTSRSPHFHLRALTPFPLLPSSECSDSLMPGLTQPSCKSMVPTHDYFLSFLLYCLSYSLSFLFFPFRFFPSSGLLS